jgi:outer membrane receptor for ferrienterochelin and colicin
MIRNVLKPLGSIRVAVAVAVGFPLFYASHAFAQDPAASPAGTTQAPPGQAAAGAGTSAEVERVIVTGSNIPTAEEVGPNPVDTYRRDDITRLGVRSSTDLIHKLPASTGSQINENNTNGGDGRAEINLRGILAKETLVLQDGRRLATVGFAGSTVDINTFPVGLIDHVDILKDGASAIYGADAVSGVFNVWLIHRFRGLEMSASYGNSNLGFANDAGEETAYLLAGTGDDKTDIVVFAEWYNRAAIFSRDADIASDPNKVEWGGSNTRSGNLAGRVGAIRFSGLFNGVRPRGYYYIPNLNTTDPGARSPTPHSFPNVQKDPEFTFLGSGVPRSGGTTTVGNIQRDRAFFNFALTTPAIAPVDREHFYGSFTRDICDKYLTVFADFKYARTFWDSGLAAAPFTPDVWTDVDHPFGISSTGISVPTQNPFNPFTVADFTSPGGTDSRFPNTRNSAPAAGTEFTTGVRYRGIEQGLRTDKITTNNYLFTGGLKGNLGEFGDYLKTWNWETGFRYNEDARLERFGGIVNNNALRAALLDTNPATAFNPFGLNVNNKFMRDGVFVTTNHTGKTSLTLEDIKLSGDLFSLPAGPVSFAIGGDHQTGHTSDEPDALTASGQTTGATNFAPTKGSRDVWSAYWEVRVPVTSPTWNFPGLYSLELNYQERYDNFSDFGDTERPKVSARWQPFDSALTVRATYSEAFHAPTLGELFSGVTQSFPNVVDPNSNATEPQVEQHFSGNPNLQPETAYEWTYGAVMTPGKWWSPLQGLTVSADFYHIDLRGVSVALDAQALIDINDKTGAFASQIIRDPGNNNAILLLDTPIQNLGRFIQEGWDYEMVYIFDTNRLGHGDWGTLTATFNGTYIDRAVVQFFPNGPEEVVVGKFGGGFLGENGGGSLTHNRWYASIFYDGPQGSWLGGVDTGITAHFVGQYWDSRLFTAGLGVNNDEPNSGARVVPDPNAPGEFRVLENQNDRKVREWLTWDWILNYTFSFPAPAAATEVAGYSKDGGKNVKMKDGKDKNVMPVSTAEYNPCGWRAWLNQTTLTLGINNFTDKEPAFVAAAFENGYDEQTGNLKGRFWYVGIKKRF